MLHFSDYSSVVTSYSDSTLLPSSFTLKRDPGDYIISPPIIQEDLCIYIYVYIFLTVLGLCRCMRAFSSCGEQELLFAEHGL